VKRDDETGLAFDLPTLFRLMSIRTTLGQVIGCATAAPERVLGGGKSAA